ncbi:MAG: sporulation initiation factor Spo0A C-terminal domain-containing protein [Clostridia bacterium]|nr:sporulation initiation factor Spo0A C-terminal domain-containing protein [Clostridia bacterium]
MLSDGGNEKALHLKILVSAPGKEMYLNISSVLSRIQRPSFLPVKNIGELLSSLDGVLPDILIIHALIPGLDERNISLQIEKLPLYKYPAVILAYPDKLPRGYPFSISTRANEEELLSAIRSVYPVPVRKSIILRAERLLENMGIPECPSRRYLSYAVAMAVNDGENARRLSKAVYPEIGRAFGVSPRRIDNAMRRLIDKAWMTGDIEKQYSYFGNTIDDMRGKPTLSALIALSADIIRIGEDEKAP